MNVKSKGGDNAFNNYQVLLRIRLLVNGRIHDGCRVARDLPAISGRPEDRGRRERTRLDYKAIVSNNTVKGKLIAVPWTADFGLLYYRKDLLKKYKVGGPPQTWSALGNAATKIQKAEQKHNPKFFGFAYQGTASEDLTANALEWIESFGGGTIVAKGKATVNNAKTVQALNLMKSWVGKITPASVTTYDGNATRALFDSGDAAFVRQWASMYDSTKSSPSVKGKLGVSALPRGPKGKSSATVAGWELGVSKFSKHKGAAEAFVRYYSSQQMELWRAVQGGFVPAMPSLSSIKAVQKVEPFLRVATTRVMRPSNALGPNYYQGSIYVYGAVHSVLTGGSTKANLNQLQSQLNLLLK